MELYVSLNGKYPRSEALIRVTRDYDRGRADTQALAQAYASDYQEVRTLQNGWAWRSDGLLVWQDLLRPFAELVPGTQVLGLVRYYETNTFYRFLSFPKFTFNVDWDSWLDRYFRFGNLAILPGPTLFTRFSEGLNLPQIYTLLTEVIGTLKKKGYQMFYLQEPELVYSRASELPPGYTDFLRHVRNLIEPGLLIVNTYFGSVAPIQKALLQSEADGIGIDFKANAIEDIIEQGWDPEKGLVAGIVDTENSYLEQLADVQALLTQIQEHLRPRFLVLTGHADFEFLPRTVADQKAAFLAQVKEALK